MSTVKKLIIKFLTKQTSISIDDVIRLLGYFGYEEKHIRGSHHIFRKAGCPPITVPVHGKSVLRCYVQDIIEVLDLEAWNEQNK